jgi:hypothetical protein
MLRTRKGPQPKVWTDRNGVTRKRFPDGKVFVSVKCECCKKCWRQEGSHSCIYGGPYWLPDPPVENAA